MSTRKSNIQDYISSLVLEVADYTISTKSTVRQTAKKFGISKSTVHIYLTKRLPILDSKKAKDARRVLLENKARRTIRGGEATRQLYERRACEAYQRLRLNRKENQ